MMESIPLTVLLITIILSTAPSVMENITTKALANDGLLSTAPAGEAGANSISLGCMHLQLQE